ncbi:hypothetical protein EG329_013591 [Mollisiaceae sp. DMI_Dod_QoI]|nr:hypothetical protein EG329_013591 [Helotiales sp. DMI_Dod_QoI]
MDASFSGVDIITGIWTNHDFGTVKGATLTITTRNGGYLIAFLAILISVAGGNFWTIIRFILHQSKAAVKNTNAYYAQQQIILRHSDGPIHTARKLIQISWAWRRIMPGSFLRSLHLVTFAFIILSLFSVAAIFSSEVTKAAGSTALLASKNCGYYSVFGPTRDDITANIALHKNIAADFLSATSYAHACYGKKESLQCMLYAEQEIGYTVNMNVSCPFDESICLVKGNNSIELDTGLMDSHKDFGVNAPPDRRVSYRKVTTCSPLDITNFTVLENSTDTDPDYRFDPGDPNYRINAAVLQQYIYMGEIETESNYTYVYNTESAYGANDDTYKLA